jgi:hypothetical protein
MVVISMNYYLPQKYTELGFHISSFGMKSMALKHQGRTVFVFGSALDLRDDFIGRLCDSYLKIFLCGISHGLSQ